MRLFIAIDLPQEILDNLERLLDGLRPTARLKWSPVSNLHITTKFIGHWPDERLQEIEAALGRLPAQSAVQIRIRNVGYFPNPRSPRVVWAGIEAGPELAALAAATETAMAALGIAPENRPFSPHLTLARIKEPVPLQSLRDAIARLPSLDFGSFRAERFCLYQSRLNRSGSVYTKLAEFPLAK